MLPAGSVHVTLARSVGGLRQMDRSGLAFAVTLATLGLSGCATSLEAPEKTSIWMFERSERAGRCNFDIRLFDPPSSDEDWVHQGLDDHVLPAPRQAVRLVTYAYSVNGHLVRRPLPGEVRCLTVVRMDDANETQAASFGFTLRAIDDETVEIRARSVRIENAVLRMGSRPTVGLSISFAIAPAPDHHRPGRIPAQAWTKGVMEFGSLAVSSRRTDVDGIFATPWPIGLEPMSLLATVTERTE